MSLVFWDFDLESGFLPAACALVLAMEIGYVIDDAAALLKAASKNVVIGEGFSRLSLESNIYFNASFKNNVIDGFSVKINVAEYPDQNPFTPFSSRICAVISPDVFPDVAVCFLVTMFANGVVNSFENAPARIPMANSSNAGSTTLVCFLACCAPNRALILR